MSGNHNHVHNNHSNVNGKLLKVAFLLTFIFALVEIIVSLFVKSIAGLSEGTHMMSDAAALLLSVIAIMLGKKKPTDKRTFGFRRVETIVAFLNGLALVIIPVIFIFEAFERLVHKTVVYGEGMLPVAIMGLIINVIVAFILSKGDTEKNLNMKSAFLHVFADITSSIGLIISSLLVIFFGWNFVDPIVSIIVAIVILSGGTQVVKESWITLMEGTPLDIDVSELREKISSVEGVASIEQLKVWSIASNDNHINLHVKIFNEYKSEEVLIALKNILHELELKETIQVEK